MAPLVVAFWLQAPAFGEFSASLNTSLPSGQFLGTEIRLDAVAVDPPEGIPLYQFSYREVGETNWKILRDFAIWTRFGWTPLEEGTYELQVVVGVLSENPPPAAVSVIEFTILPRVSVWPAVSPIGHPLMTLYSSPGCSNGVTWVRYRPIGSPVWQTTSAKPCETGKTFNIYVAGMRANTTYQIQHERFDAGGFRRGPMLYYRTGVPTVSLPEISIVQEPTADISFLDDTLLLTHVIESPERSFPFAVDLAGNLIWYYDELGIPSQLSATIPRAVAGGTFLVQMASFFNDQVLREIDLAGNIVKETSVGAVNLQLAAMGEEPITAMHHEAIRIPNGHTLVIASSERILNDVQGEGPVNIYGEMILDLDENFQLAWVWDSFEEMDVTRAALGGEICESEGPGCPPLFNGPANDWLHANSIDYTPDGHLLMSLRHQDWVIKIDYADGTGDGHVIWRLGEEGDFTLDAPGESWAWFSHQHDAEIQNGLLNLYDNGNLRVEAEGGNSRGQVWQLDEQSMTAMLVHNFDLGGYAFAVGSSQPLSNGNYHFNSGFLGERSDPFNQSLEFSPVTNESTFILQTSGAVYRSVRMRSLYKPEIED